MDNQNYRKEIVKLVDKLEKEESLKAVHETAVVCYANEHNEKEQIAKIEQ